MYFCAVQKTCTRSSMDRISDSGSDDVGSIPAGCTIKAASTAAFFVLKTFSPLPLFYRKAIKVSKNIKEITHESNS